jgi:hypothetical protein
MHAMRAAAAAVCGGTNVGATSGCGVPIGRSSLCVDREKIDPIVSCNEMVPVYEQTTFVVVKSGLLPRSNDLRRPYCFGTSTDELCIATKAQPPSPFPPLKNVEARWSNGAMGRWAATNGVRTAGDWMGKLARAFTLDCWLLVEGAAAAAAASISSRSSLVTRNRTRRPDLGRRWMEQEGSQDCGG